MKSLFLATLLNLLPMTAIFAASTRAENTVVLDETGVKNLRIETVTVEESDFEESIFALGHIEADPRKIAAVTSRISGRIIELPATIGDAVAAGATVARVESRQPGSPPPAIALAAPIDGIVTRLEPRLGDPVEPDRALLEVTDLRVVWAVARVPESYAGKIKPGAAAHITVPAVPEETFPGKLLRFGTSADETSGTIDAIFQLENASGHLRPGMRAEFSIVLAKRANVVSVPRGALQGDAANRFVYVKDFDLPNAFVRTPVVTGQINDRFVEIVSGLLPADEVVTRGAYSLAFARGGSVSLKEALDAAHGHEHNADGSELKDAPKANAAASGPVGTTPGANSFWMIVSGGLFVLLVVVTVRGKRRRG